MTCRCQTTGHDASCWFSSTGYYLNGVKVANLPPPVILADLTTFALTTFTPAPVRVTVETR